VPSEHLRIPTREGETFVVACGPIGEPGLSAPSQPDLASDAYALWLDDVVDALGVAHASVVGVSLGGWLDVDYATRRPGRVDRIALLCPGGIGRQKAGFLFVAALYLPFGRRGRRALMRHALGVSASSMAHADPATWGFADYVLLIDRHFRPRTKRLPVFTDDVLRRPAMPVLVIVGGRDVMLDSYGTSRRVRENVPHATVDLLPETGHLLQDQTVRILAFFQAEEGARRHVRLN
jgi:pimeloyl-ACP methyl ester carboxylesterase